MDYKEIWRIVLKKLYPKLRRDQFLTWFADTALLRIDGNVAVVGVPSQFVYDWIAKHYRSLILQTLTEEVPSISEVTIVVDCALSNKDDTRAVDVSTLNTDEKKVRKLPGRQEVKLGDDSVSLMLNSRYSLHNFMVGKHNRLVHAACLAVATNPGQQWNPLFIYGGVGLGKTHLLQGTGREILKIDHSRRIIYLTAERFLNEVVDAIKKYNAHDFKARYRNVDCLIIDDIQLLADKDRTQEEFFHIFNELYNGNKQVIISSDKAPQELAGIEKRLQSRFEMGMVAEVHFPDYETRLAILQHKCAEQGVILDPEILNLIAQSVSKSIRELEGVLTQAIAQMQLEQMQPTVQSISKVIRKTQKMSNENDISSGGAASGPNRSAQVRNADELIKCVAEYYRVNKDDLVGPERRREIMFPRQICMYLIYDVLGLSYDTIGDYFSGRNHTTVLHSYNKIKSRMRTDTRLVQDIFALKREIGA